MMNNLVIAQIYQNAAGNVGVGTTKPCAKVNIAGGSDAALADGSGDLVLGSINGKNIVMDGNEIMARDNGAESALHFQADGGDLFVHQNQAAGTEFIIKDSGNVGIGTKSPTEKVEVVGNIKLSAPDTDIYSMAMERTDEDKHKHIWKFWHMNSAYGKNSLQIWEYKDIDNDGKCCGDDDDGSVCSPRVTIAAGGNVGIGTKNPQKLLHVSGDFLIDNKGAITSKKSDGTIFNFAYNSGTNEFRLGPSSTLSH